MSKEREVSEGGGSGGAINARKRPSGSREDLEDDAGIGHTNNRRPVAVASAVSSPLSPSGALVPFAAISNNHRSSNNMQHHQQLQHGGGSAGAAAAAAAAAAAIVTPCAACKLLRRRCAQECPFAPYFSPHEPHKFACVHKIYGASNVSKMLMEVPENQRADTANSLVYEANARIRDPVYGCMGVISALQQQARSLQAELSAVKAEVMRYRASHAENAALMQIAAAVNSPFTNNNAPNNPTLNPASNSPSLVQPPDNITYISNSTNSATSADSSIKNERFWSTLG